MDASWQPTCPPPQAPSRAGEEVLDGGTESASGATPTLSVQIGARKSPPLVRGSEATVDEAGVVWGGDGIATHGKQMRQDKNPQLMQGKVQ